MRMNVEQMFICDLTWKFPETVKKYAIGLRAKCHVFLVDKLQSNDLPGCTSSSVGIIGTTTKKTKKTSSLCPIS